MKSIIKTLCGIIFFVLLIFIISCQKSNYINDMKPLIDAYVKVWNTGDVDSLDQLTVPLFELRMPPKFTAVIGRDSLKKEILETRKTYPDFFITIEDELIKCNNGLAASWTITATNTGPGSFPPTGRQVTSHGFSVITFSEGKISGEWIAYSDLDWITQLEFTVAPPQNIGQ